MSRQRKTYALFTGDGRLGNQMFEAAFLDGVLRPGDNLFTTGMEDLLEGFVWDRMHVHNKPIPHANRHIKRFIRHIGRLAVTLRLVRGIRQQKQRFDVGGKSYMLQGERIASSQGLFPNLLYIDKGYFQGAALAQNASFRLKDDHLAAARVFLNELPPGPRAFVHMRRGDYRSWKIFDRSPLLDVAYFRRGIALIRERAPDAQFILLSDEAPEIALGGPDLGLHTFAGANVYEDFGLMTLCDGGVMSNSTLSWWAGFFCARKLPLVSPRGWLAINLGFEYPAGITATWMTPIEP